MIWKWKWGKERQTGRETERSFHLLFHSSNAYNSKGWARFKLGARDTTQGSHIGDRDPSPWAVINYIPGLLVESWTESRDDLTSVLQYGMQARPAAVWLAVPQCPRSHNWNLKNDFVFLMFNCFYSFWGNKSGPHTVHATMLGDEVSYGEQLWQLLSTCYFPTLFQQLYMFGLSGSFP